MDATIVEILLKARSEGILEIRQLKEALEELRRQAEITNEILAFTGAAMFTTSLAVTAMSEAMSKTKGPTQAVSEAGNTFGEVWAKVRAVLVAVAIEMIIMTAVALAPLLVEIVAATFILAAFIAGMTAAALVIAFAAAAIGGMGIAVLVLAERLFQTGKIAHDPLLSLESAFTKMADKWGTAALPMANQIVKWLDQLIPLVTTAGLQLLHWFGEHLPKILDGANNVMTIFLNLWKQLGEKLGPVFDIMGAHAPQLESLFAVLLWVAIQVVPIVLMWLINLSLWFEQRLPVMLPIVQQIMGGIGIAFGAIFTVAAKIVDFFMQHWDEIRKTTDETWKAIKAGWDVVGPILGPVAQATLQTLGDFFKFCKDHGDTLRGIMMLLGIQAAVVMVIFDSLVIILVGVLTVVIQLIDWGGQFIRWLGDAAGKAGSLAEALGRVWGVMRAIQGGGNAPSSGAGTAGGAGASGGPVLSAQHGGFIPGLPGAPVVIQAHAGEVVLSPNLLEAMVGLLQQLVHNTTPSQNFSNAAYGRA